MVGYVQNFQLPADIWVEASMVGPFPGLIIQWVPLPGNGGDWPVLSLHPQTIWFLKDLGPASITLKRSADVILGKLSNDLYYYKANS